MTKISISEAARRAQVERTTLYRKREKGDISFDKDGDGKPCIELSELTRIYPNAYLGHIDNMSTPVSHNDANPLNAQIDTVTKSNDSVALQVEAAVLRERVTALERERDKLVAEAVRERTAAELAREEIKAERERVLGLLEVQTRLLTGHGRKDQTQKRSNIAVLLTVLVLVAAAVAAFIIKSGYAGSILNL